MGSSVDNIEKLYKNYDVLNEAKEKSEHEHLYKEILDAVKGETKEKRLASQFIGKFFKYFPNLADEAIDRQLDLCEDEDVQIRRQAIKDLPQLCKETKDHTPKIADILAQLLVTEDTAELVQVHLSLQTLAKYDTLGTLTGIINQIISGDEQTRSRSFQYLSGKFIKLGSEVITKEVEDFMIAELKKILQDVTADEFHLCMAILNQTKLGRTVTGQGELVALAVEQADMDTDLGTLAAEDETVERFIQCSTEAIPFFSSQVESTPFVKFMCDKLLPNKVWSLIGAGDEDQSQTHLRLLKVFAESCTYCGSLELPSEKIEAIFHQLLEYMPLPPVDADLNETPSFQFSHAECLLYALHAIGKQCPEYLTFPSDPNKLKDFRSRLQYLARGTQGYIKKLQEAIKGKTAEELKTVENQIKVTALKTTSNISTLIRDLFHSPPSFKSTINLSWVAPKMRASVNVNNKKDTSETPTAGSKRHAPITFTSANGSEDTKGRKTARSANGSSQQVYSPPSGKYSGKMRGNNNGGGNNGNSGGPRRRFRGGNRSGGNVGGAGGGGGGGGGNRNFGRNFNRRSRTN